jgi:hypothetical protein
MPTAPTDPATTTIYVRVPRVVKDGAAEHAESNGLTLTAAITDLLDRGLEAVDNESSIETLQEQLRQKDAELRETTARLRGLEALANQPLGICANCKGVITAVDVLVHRQCRNGHPLKAPDGSNAGAGSGLDESQSLLLIGAVGLLLGALVLANSTG